MSRLASEAFGIIGVIDPNTGAPGSTDTGWISAALFERFMAVLALGTVAATGTVDAKIEQATDASGTGAKDVTGKAITQLGDTDDDKQAIINLKADELDVNNGFDHVRVLVTVGTAAAEHALLLFGARAKDEPASDDDLASVAEIVV